MWLYNTSVFAKKMKISKFETFAALYPHTGNKPACFNVGALRQHLVNYYKHTFVR